MQRPCAGMLLDPNTILGSAYSKENTALVQDRTKLTLKVRLNLNFVLEAQSVSSATRFRFRFKFIGRFRFRFRFRCNTRSSMWNSCWTAPGRAKTPTLIRPTWPQISLHYDPPWLNIASRARFCLPPSMWRIWMPGNPNQGDRLKCQAVTWSRKFGVCAVPDFSEHAQKDSISWLIHWYWISRTSTSVCISRSFFCVMKFQPWQPSTERINAHYGQPMLLMSNDW